ncbi:MAG: Gfo/Idh/MocA family oxidoreductase, partial [Dehalococcoidales bacterium]|nr:Gfo/Idh/MocA family oxidoreductase [Dehalococcoidales bacterium]
RKRKMSLKSEVNLDGRRKFNALIIGCGGQGALADIPGGENSNKIISFAHALKEHPGFGDIKLYDSNPEKAIKAAEIWGCTATTIMHTHLYNGVDVAVVCTPDETHYEILKHLAEYPPRLVICEKPLCTELAQAREIVELYKAKGIPILVNYTRRFLPYYEELKKYGVPVYGELNFNRGWLHSATHGIDFFNMFGLNNYRITEVPVNYRVWNLGLCFENHFWQERRIGETPVWDYYDKSHWYIIENAYNFLEGREPLKCTGENGLKALEICFELMNKNKPWRCKCGKDLSSYDNIKHLGGPIICECGEVNGACF